MSNFVVKIETTNNAAKQLKRTLSALAAGVFAFGLFGASLSAQAAGTATPASSQDEVRVQICSIATSGIKTAAIERQAGKTKAATKRILDKDLASLSSRISNKEFLRHITDTWYRGLDKVYQDPVLPNQEDKAVYISTLTADAIVSCLSSV